MAGTVRENNVYVEDLATIALPTHQRRFATHHQRHVDWVYEEELALRNRLALESGLQIDCLLQLDSEGVRDFYLINKHGNALSKPSHRFPIRKPALEFCRARRRRQHSGGDTRWFEVPGDPRNNYIAGWTWAGQATILIHHLSRQTDLVELMLRRCAHGKSADVLRKRTRPGSTSTLPI